MTTWCQVVASDKDQEAGVWGGWPAICAVVDPDDFIDRQNFSHSSKLQHRIRQQFWNMTLYISIKGKQMGPFDEDAVLAHLASGMLSANDLAIRQGDAGWSRLGDIFAGRIPISSQQQQLDSSVGRAANASGNGPKLNWQGIFVGCYISAVVIWLGGIGILSLFGLITGNLYGPDSIELHGPLARVVSALALFYLAWAVFSIFKKQLRKRRSGRRLIT